MTKKVHFQAVIEDAGGGGAFVIIPFDVEQKYGKKRVKIKATIEGEPYRGTLVRMGSLYHMLLVLKEIRDKVGKDIGDKVSVELEEDIEPRIVEIPPDLQHALDAAPLAQASFNRLSYTHQKEYVRWVTEAKRPETRADRVQRTIELVNKGKSEH